ncbi:MULTISPECIES: hypothetical protein [Croceitalea]|uniref:Glycerophosphoryl diester phosphodiesterase membrane domain-containing protein n=1 Tax=Croceitalea vernalis TaxID=3075599 RepID=A0ABU3BK52_9FLAO|nr:MULTISPECIES: hypothetical protein [unclassified Croceitalea]MDT0540861.1 hypothetical protein [Croceitalea sp. P059]MDT0622548.1 hypothetical protein [Croceitalea sp. P007]
MQTVNYIEFKKQRELGEILSDTFAFIRSEFKPFFGTLLKIVGPYILIMLISSGFYIYTVGDIMNITTLQADNQIFSPIIMILAGLALFVSSIMAYVVSHGTVLCYIRSYTENKGKIFFEDIKKGVYANFWSLIGLGFLVGLSIMAGIIFCLIPGIYLGVCLSVSFAILIFQKKNVSDAYSESFSLVKENWWITFATLFVIYIIIYIASLAFSLPTIIYTWAKMGIFSGEVDAENMNIFSDPIYLILNLISQIIQFLMNIILLVSITFIYFNLNERKNFTGTFETIENLGKQTN